MKLIKVMNERRTKFVRVIILWGISYTHSATAGYRNRVSPTNCYSSKDQGWFNCKYQLEIGHSVGFINPILYKLSAQNGIFHDIAIGNNNITNGNGAYKATLGWDACTSLGSPEGTKLMNTLENFHS